ncbi:MAG TPA: TRAP transporter TatT component family protein, partial [Myxococcales bacterium]
MKIHGALLAALLLVLAQLGCSRAASRVVADALSSGAGNVYGSDDDPELVRDAVPFGLKTLEALLERHPEHEGLLLSLASGFTQYTFAFVDSDADALEMAGKSAQARPVRERARHLYLRARDYGLRGLEARHKGSAAKLREIRDLDPTLGALNKDDVPLVYWTAASWALAIAAGKEDIALVSQLPVPGALVERALALDESFDEGALHEFSISWQAAQGGEDGLRSATRHFERAIELSK